MGHQVVVKARRSGTGGSRSTRGRPCRPPAEPATTDDMLIGGVKAWATDPRAASRLWDLSSELTGVDAF